MIEQRITPTISTIEEARQFEDAAAAAGQQIDVQVEIDTGMGRVGFWHEDALSAIKTITALPHLRLSGTYTHFPSADSNLEETRRELGHYLGLTAALDQRGIATGKHHVANSAAMLTVQESILDQVRPGLLLYGISPCQETMTVRSSPSGFAPVLAFKARVTFVKQVEAGRSISYGQTFIAPSPMTIATVAAGYGDGFSWHLSNHAHVLVHGKRCPVVGRVTMDQIMVDITSVSEVVCGDEVVLIGRQDKEEITALEVAQWAHTIPWEVLCGITRSPRVRRVFSGVHAG